MQELARSLEDLFAQKLLTALGALSVSLKAVLQDVATESGVSLLQIQVVLALNNSAPCRMGYIASRLGVTRATASDAVAAAERKGLVDRCPDPEDGRGVIVGMSPLGRDLANQVGVRLAPFFTPDEATSQADQSTALRVLLAEIRRMRQAGIETTLKCCTTCVHYQPGEGDGGARCHLLDVELADDMLRVNCPDHVSI